MDLFKLLGTIAVDNAAANQAIDETNDRAKKAGESFDDLGDSGQRSSGRVGKFFSGLGRGALAVGKVTVAGIGAASTAIAGVTGVALNSAGELEQNMGGSEAVFGKYAEMMQSTAEGAYASMGLSASDYLATANQMGALFQGTGLSAKESMNLTAQAMQRAADVASIMGLDTSAAMEAVTGAAKGNFTMMDNLGVAMNETTLAAYALEKGYKKDYAEMTQAEKELVAMEMFMDRTSYAAGNYAKENETLAGSLGTAKAALGNFLSGAGTVDQLVGALSGAANVIVNNITSMFPALMNGLTELVAQVVPLIPPLLDQLLPALIEGATTLINGIVAAFPAIVSALMGALPALIDGVVSIINALIAALPAIMEALVAALPTLIPQLIDGLVSMIVMLCETLPQIIQPLIDHLPEIIVAVVNALITNLPALIMGVVTLVGYLIQALPEIWNAVVLAIETLLSGWIASLLEWAAPLIEAVSAWWDGVKQSASEKWEEIKAKISEKWEEIKTKISEAINNVKETMSTVWNGIKNTITIVWNGIKSGVTTAVMTVKTTISTAFNTVKTTVGNIWDGIKSKITQVWTGIKTGVATAVTTVKTTISSAFNTVKTTATNIWNGIKSAIQGPIEAARDLVSGAIESIKGYFDFDFTWPSLKMPHFSFSGSWNPFDWPGQFPKIGVSWYAKAMHSPMLLDDPTIFGYDPNSGQLMGGGEAGSEVVAGANSLMGMIGNAVSGNMALHTEKIVSVLLALLEAVTGGNQEIVQALLAGQSIKIGEREFGRVVREAIAHA